MFEKRLKVSGFSIVSNNCVGGVILHDLGLKFLTPKKWVERSRRIQFDKICLIIHTDSQNYELLKKIDSLPYPKMIITNTKHVGIENERVICLPDNDPGRIFNYVGQGVARYLEDIDYVSFLNEAFSSERRELNQ